MCKDDSVTIQMMLHFGCYDFPSEVQPNLKSPFGLCWVWHCMQMEFIAFNSVKDLNLIRVSVEGVKKLCIDFSNNQKVSKYHIQTV